MKSKTIITLIILAILCARFAPPVQAAPAAALTVSITPVVLNFGNIKANTISPSQAVKVINKGDAAFTLDAMTVAGEFAINNKCNGMKLEPDESCTFLVAFKPSLPNGIKNGTVTISNDSGSPPSSVTLYGVSYDKPQLLQHENFEPPSGFVFRAPIRWETGPVSVPLFAVWDCTVSMSDKCSVRLSGNPRWGGNVQQTIYQWGEISGPAGTQFFFGLSSKADGIPTGGKYLVQLAFYNLNGQQVGAFPLRFSDGTHDFEINDEVVSVPAAFNYFVYSIIFQETSGTAWFDNAVLIRLP